jgi:hypothetical protein
MTLDDALRTVRQVAALPSGPVCACCGVELPPECATLPWRCPHCRAHGCEPFFGIMKCLGVTDDDLGDLPRAGEDETP